MVTRKERWSLICRSAVCAALYITSIIALIGVHK